MSYDNPELPANMQKLEKQMTDNFGQKHKQILYEKIMSYGDNMYMMGMAEFQQHKYATDEALFRTSEENKKEIVELINLLIVKRELEMKEKWGEYDETEQTMYRDILEYIDIYGEQAGWSRVKQVCRMALKGSDPREVMRKDEAKNYTPALAPAPKVTDEYVRGVNDACDLLEKDIITDGQVVLGERWSQDYPQWKADEIRKELKAPAVAPKVTEKTPRLIELQARSFCDVYCICADLGMKHIEGNIDLTDVISFIRSLAQRAGEERYTVEQIRHLEKWMKGFLRITIPSVQNPSQVNIALVDAIKHINDPQDGIKAITKKGG
jgi:hypothetical protein